VNDLGDLTRRFIDVNGSSLRKKDTKHNKEQREIQNRVCPALGLEDIGELLRFY
jgi:hypothetical protein